MKVRAYIHSPKDHRNDRHILDEAEIIRCVGDNIYLYYGCGTTPVSL